MKTGLKHLLTVCLAAFRHLSRSTVVVSALMLVTTSGCLPGGDDVEIITNPVPDGDGDGWEEWEDCDDNDPEVGAPAEGEECEMPSVEECEGDPDCNIITNSAPDELDIDGDGWAAWEDCDDDDPEVGAPAEGEECEPVIVDPIDECEEDPNCDIVTNPVPDGDGDGVAEWDDCDDNDPEVGAPAEGEECEPVSVDPIDECEEDPDCDIVTNPVPDGDGDGVAEWDDCDDNDPEVGAPAEGEECEPVSVDPIDECEDDPDCGIIVNPAPDADRDGIPEWEDCDDMNPRIGAAPEGEECPPPTECEDDPDCGIIVNPAPDADRDGVPEWEDCDDMNPRIGAAPEGEECPPPPVDE